MVSNIAGGHDTSIFRDFKITWILKMEAACSSEELLSASRIVLITVQKTTV